MTWWTWNKEKDNLAAEWLFNLLHKTLMLKYELSENTLTMFSTKLSVKSVTSFFWFSSVAVFIFQICLGVVSQTNRVQLSLSGKKSEFLFKNRQHELCFPAFLVSFRPELENVCLYVLLCDDGFPLQNQGLMRSWHIFYIVFPLNYLLVYVSFSFRTFCAYFLNNFNV